MEVFRCTSLRTALLSIRPVDFLIDVMFLTRNVYDSDAIPGLKMLDSGYLAQGRHSFLPVCCCAPSQGHWLFHTSLEVSRLRVRVPGKIHAAPAGMIPLCELSAGRNA
jgi:hypothetical protein